MPSEKASEILARSGILDRAKATVEGMRAYAPDSFDAVTESVSVPRAKLYRLSVDSQNGSQKNFNSGNLDMSKVEEYIEKRERELVA